MADVATVTDPEITQVRADLSGFVRRHIGPDARQVESMLADLGVSSLDELIDATIPEPIRYRGAFDLEPGLEEAEALDALRERASANELYRSFIGMGYYGTSTPAVIQRGVLENPAWYTAYTPYQAEISQGRLEALVAFQTLVCDLTGLEVANASLLDEATAAAESMSVAYQAAAGRSRGSYLVDERCHPHTVDVLETRAQALGFEVVVTDLAVEPLPDGAFGVLLQNPGTDGSVRNHADAIRSAHEAGALVTVATDLLALAMIRPPGELGADMAIGSSQRFGVPMGFGGPHAGFLAARDSLKRRLPGRIVGVSRDVSGQVAYRLALQTREQHIRREKATSNICTAQVLPAVLAAMYAVYHGPEGLLSIAQRVHEMARRLAVEVAAFGHQLSDRPFFDTLRIMPKGLDPEVIRERTRQRHFNVRWFADGAVGVSLDETTSDTHVDQLVEIFETDNRGNAEPGRFGLDQTMLRSSPFLEHPVFHRYRTETEMMRYLHGLADKDLSLTRSMIALGSCTMKLNAASEMQPISWRKFAHLHPFAPPDQTTGFAQLFSELEAMLCTLTGFAAVSLQPNAGSQGEYAGLLAIRRYQVERGEPGRRICLIPRSAHGTNPASAVMAGMSVVAVACDSDGNIEVDDLRAKAEEHRERLAALMVTYPSTHGVFEESIREVCEVVHENGGQVYLDGANFNAMVGLCRPADLGVDVCHLNLHKTFCIPHGGGGPGVGPIAVAPHLVGALPGHSIVAMAGRGSSAAVAAAPWGSASILPISWMYIRMMGLDGLRKASQIAILNANYVATRLADHYPILYTGANGRVAHECILDLRPLKKSAGVEVEDVAKRLIDYGFHAPTVSWPVAGTLMVEPTESEAQAELDRFCDAMIGIREEARAIERGDLAVEDSALRHAPHPAESLLQPEWDRAYSREDAAYPAPWLRTQKYWPPVGRIDNVYGDRNLVCSCPPMEAYESDED